MPAYKIKGSRSNGVDATVQLFAVDRLEAASLASQQGIKVESVWALSEESKKKGVSLDMQLGGPKKAQPKEVAIFCRQLAISVQAGLPLRDALEGILEELEVNTLQISLKKVAADLSSGSRFAAALTEHNTGKVFSPVFIGLIRVAEETGTLSEVLNDLADYLEEGAKLKSDIMGKLSYPIFMIVAFILTNLGSTFFLFPMFEKNFEGLGGKLPELTLFVFAMNNKAVAAAPYVFALLAVVGVFAAKTYLTKAGRLKIDQMLLKLPAVGDLFFKINTARFCRTLAITAKGGLGLTEGIEIGTEVVTNAYLKANLSAARGRIMNGQSFTSSLRETGAFTGLVLRMVGVGEESGQLPAVLDKISQIYGNEVDSAIAKAMSLIEPAIICLFGVFVSVMVLALYMPVFEMGN